MYTTYNTYIYTISVYPGTHDLNKKFKYLIKISFVFFVWVVYNCVCECSVGVDVRDGTDTPSIFTIISAIVMGCIVLGRQMKVHFGMPVSTNTLQADGYGPLLKKWQRLKHIRNHLIVHNPKNTCTTLKRNKRNEQIALAKSMVTELQRIIVDRKSDANLGYPLSPGRLLCTPSGRFLLLRNEVAFLDAICDFVYMYRNFHVIKKTPEEKEKTLQNERIKQHSRESNAWKLLHSKTSLQSVTIDETNSLQLLNLICKQTKVDLIETSGNGTFMLTYSSILCKRNSSAALLGKGGNKARKIAKRCAAVQMLNQLQHKVV